MIAKETSSTVADEMAQFTSITVAATYDPTSQKVTLSVEAWGEQRASGIELREIKRRSNCFRDSNVLCVEVIRVLGEAAPPWRTAEPAVFDRAADFAVLQTGPDGYVLAVKPVERI